MNTSKRWLIVILMSCLLLLACLYGLIVGAVSFSFDQIMKGIGNKESSMARAIIWDLRVPRVLVGVIVGMCLATAGSLLQGVMRNPLADPGIIGVSSGAGLMATLVMVVFPEYTIFLPLAAFVGACVTAFVIYGLAWNKGASPGRIILVGISINAVIGASMSALMLLYSDRVQSVLPWLAGGISGVSWSQFNMIIYYAVIALGLSVFAVKHVRILMLGDEVAKLIGHKVERSRFFLIVLSTLLSGIAVSVSGLIGFVGLVVPHIVRLLVGNDYRFLLPISALGGGLLVVIADAIARSWFDPIELPVGILLSFLGGPFFLFILQKGGKQVGQRSAY
ncbi:FecCD family ABC transporter permease [Paenibacillus sp. KN14-4R]|uniref:FecCD family ABC transporter permease n=1 Tax=Paenibacillus sp. KN14-4R TaxID=3445773 RepID=UPI003F9F1D17